MSKKNNKGKNDNYQFSQEKRLNAERAKKKNKTKKERRQEQARKETVIVKAEIPVEVVLEEIAAARREEKVVDAVETIIVPAEISLEDAFANIVKEREQEGTVIIESDVSLEEAFAKIIEDREKNHEVHTIIVPAAISLDKALEEIASAREVGTDDVKTIILHADVDVESVLQAIADDRENRQKSGQTIILKADVDLENALQAIANDRETDENDREIEEDDEVHTVIHHADEEFLKVLDDLAYKGENDESSEKFQFATMDEDDHLEKTLVGQLEAINEQERKEEEEFFQQKAVKVEPTTHSDSKNVTLKRRVHFSFEARVATMILCILLMFITICFLITETLRYGKNEVVEYNEVSSVGYNVCLLPNTDYSEACLEEGLTYLPSLTDTINVYYNYDVDFSTDISYDLGYHVDLVMSIFDKNNPEKIFYTSTDTLLDTVKIENVDNFISFDTDVVAEFQKYNVAATNYIDRYQLDAAASIDIGLYLDEEKETRKLSSVTVPLGAEPYMIQKDFIEDNSGKVELDGNFWNEYNIICAIIASILLIITLFLLYRTTRFVLKVTDNRNRYQKRLDQILRDYDRLIVIARDGYESNLEREVIKVSTFEELLDARSTLQKPIIYSKINDVKSEFIVEDDEKLYKYVLKDTDI